MPAGILLVDKPKGPTSHDVVERIRRALPRGTRVGHTGTLDPLATGLLILCVGAATRLARFLAGLDKEYLATIRLGVATDTYDADGTVLEQHPVPELSEARLIEVLEPLAGRRGMVPPPFSAKKRGGERLYRAARRGAPVAVEPVEVTIHKLELAGFGGETVDLRVHCSAGTYVRALAHELGQALGCGGHLLALRRTRVGEFQDSQATALGPLEAGLRGGQIDRYLLPPEAAMPQLPELTLDGEALKKVTHGGDIEAPARGALPPNGLVRLLAGAGELVAVAECRAGPAGRPHLHPVVVLVQKP